MAGMLPRLVEVLAAPSASPAPAPCRGGSGSSPASGATRSASVQAGRHRVAEPRERRAGARPARRRGRASSRRRCAGRPGDWPSGANSGSRLTPRAVTTGVAAAWSRRRRRRRSAPSGCRPRCGDRRCGVLSGDQLPRPVPKLPGGQLHGLRLGGRVERHHVDVNPAAAVADERQLTCRRARPAA